MTARMAALIVGALDAAAWLLIAGAMVLSQSDHATRGLDSFAGAVVTALFVATGLPALLLVWRKSRARLALVLALGFPAAIVALLGYAVATLP